ncbi:MAG TPA: diacylglycerol kinase family protein [Candidatus Polarisedimenticolia bacterium]|nr:diacylglycerol kinase family protein [Candidatus Polarisedimenticolia bacterium]
MRKAFLIYNPASGRRRAKRTLDIARVVEVLRSAGVETETCGTTHVGSAIQQVREAVGRGFDTVVACGGDGTANEALNGIMQASALRTSGDVALGLLPLGSGNLLASDLGLPSDPVEATKKLLTYQPREFRPGLVCSQGANGPEKRYFLVAAGVGSDAELMYRTEVKAKERWGRNAYFLEMARMALRRRYPMFQVEWEDEQGKRQQGAAMLAMCVRAGKFPGLLSLVNLGTSLLRHDFCLLLFRTNKIRRFLSYFAGVATGRNWKVESVDAIHTKWFRCTAIPGMRAVHSQADGELLGTLPAELTIESRPVKLLME